MELELFREVGHGAHMNGLGVLLESVTDAIPLLLVVVVVSFEGRADAEVESASTVTG